MAQLGVTVSEVAHRLGVAPATLRTWDRRYGLGPSSHEAGEHRRYTEEDLARLAAMRRLVVSGVPPQQAALLAKTSPISVDEPLPLPKFQNREDVVAAIVRALEGIDSAFVEALIRREILSAGIIKTWNEILVPSLVLIGKRWEETGSGIEIEHLYSEIVKRIMRECAQEIESPKNSKPVLLASIGEEHHCLAIHALAAALAEENIATHFLGARTPVEALAEMVRKTHPPVVFLWAQLAKNADYSAMTALPALRPAPRLILGGPGWRADRVLGATMVDNLHEACELVGSTIGK
jgi:DNA-binding transcriptional MerR regulator